MLEFYMKRSDLKHNWEEIKAAERKIDSELYTVEFNDLDVITCMHCIWKE